MTYQSPAASWLLHAEEVDNHDLHATLEGTRGKHTSNVLLEIVGRPSKARVAVDWGR